MVSSCCPEVVMAAQIWTAFQHIWWLLLGDDVAVGATCSPWETLDGMYPHQDLICWGLI